MTMTDDELRRISVLLWRYGEQRIAEKFDRWRDQDAADSEWVKFFGETAGQQRIEADEIP